MYVPTEVLKAVGFVAAKKDEGEYVIGGTVFFVTLEKENHTWAYAVTARHVIEAIRQLQSKVYFRLNMKSGTFDWFESKIEDWRFHPTDPIVDVAVLPWAPPSNTYNTSVIRHDWLMNQGHIDQYCIGPGDETAIVGLFFPYPGTQRNIPIVRIGNIAAMPPEKIFTEMSHANGNMDTYLIEARSTGGLSGSPVFWSMGYTRRVGDHDLTATRSDEADGVFVCMGLIHAHLDERESKLSQLLGKPINMGIALVVPMDRIREVLYQEEFEMKRSKDIEKHKRKYAPTLDSSLLARSIVEAAIGEPLTEKTKKPRKKANKRAK